jgi:putative flippase GtrA
MGSEDGSYSAPDGRALTGQIGRFFVVGILATATHYLVAMLWLGWVSVWLANLLGYLAAVAVSYFGHQRITFRVPVAEVSHQRQAPRFLLTSLGGLAISYLVLLALNMLLSAPDWLSLACVVTLVPVYTYIANKYWVFKLAGPPRG